MSNSYFKFRNRFDFNPHKYDIGYPFTYNKLFEDNFFVLKIYQLEESEYRNFYQHQANSYLKINPSGEEAFFKHVYDAVAYRIKYLKRQDPFSSKYVKGLECIRKLELFLEFLKTIDRWHQTAPLESVISEKNNEIAKLKLRILELESRLKETGKYEASEKIVIARGGLPALVNLIHQLQELVLPNENKLVRSQAQSPWYKMIAKYFMHGDKDISIDTARNYFPAHKDDIPAKFIEISEKDKLFKIGPRGKQ